MSISWMIEILEKGKAYPVGTIRKWGGLDYMKHPQGWIVVTQGKHYGKMKGQVRSGVAQPHHVDFLNSRKEQSQTNTNAPSNEVKPSPIQTPSPDQKPQVEVKPEGEKKKRGRPKKVIPEGQAEGQKEGEQPVKKERKPREKKPISKIIDKLQPQAKPITAVKTYEEMTPEEVIQSFTPQLTPSELQRPMSAEEFDANMGKMSQDDMAWHLMNCADKDHEHINNQVDNEISLQSSIILGLLNKNRNKKSKTNDAEYYLDKIGVKFVGGKGSTFFVKSLALTGQVDKGLAKIAEESEDSSRAYFGMTDPEEFKKINIEENAYQLSKNKNTPLDVLEKIADLIKTGKIEPFLNKTLDLDDLANHPNASIEMIMKHSMGGSEQLSRLWKKKDLPPDLKEKVLNAGMDRMSVPPQFEVDEKTFNHFWERSKEMGAKDQDTKNSRSKGQKAYANSHEYNLEDFAENPNAPKKILEEILNLKNEKLYKNDSTIEDNSAIIRGKKAAYKAMVERGFLSEDDIVNQVNKVLKIKGDKSLLKEFGERAFVYSDQPSQEKKTLIPIDPKELEELKKHLKETHAHENFEVEIEGAWTLDVETHKDFPRVAKEINTVKRGLFHGTSFDNAGGIIATGVNVGADARTGQMFGQGFYLASESSKAAQYAGDSFSTGESSGIMFELDASLGKVKPMKYGRPEDDDLYRDFGRFKEENPQFAKKADQLEKEGKPFLTKWHYDHDSVHAQAGLQLLYDEYVVKDPNQIHINKIIKIKKTPKKKVA